MDIFSVDKPYVILRDGTDETIRCRFAGSETSAQDSREFHIFSMEPPVHMIMDARDGSLIERSWLVVALHPTYYQWKERLPKGYFPANLFAYKDEHVRRAAYTYLEYIGLATVKIVPPGT